MVGIIIATHGDMANGIVNALELIMGKQDNLETLSLYHDTSIERFSEEMLLKITELDKGEGVIVFTDLFSASPYNQAAFNSQKIGDIKYRIVSGVNLPMIIEAANQRMLGASIEDISKISMESGNIGIKEFFEELEKSK